MLNIYKDTWELDLDVCPCDAHFLEFLASKKIKNGSIFHFGTGAHHMVGIGTAKAGSNNAVLAITASTGEYETYIKLITEKPEVGRTYKAFFGDIYQLDARILPEFDVVSLFHLCEFRTEANDAYDALTDLEMANILVDKLKPGGWVLFYVGSMAFDRAEPVIAKLAKQRSLERHGDFKRLQVYRKKMTAEGSKAKSRPAKAKPKAKPARSKRA